MRNLKKNHFLIGGNKNDPLSFNKYKPLIYHLNSSLDLAGAFKKYLEINLNVSRETSHLQMGLSRAESFFKYEVEARSGIEPLYTALQAAA